jgi:YVTN family beta-propeller protein
MARFIKSISSIALFSVFFLYPFVIKAQEHYHLLSSVMLGGEGGWDYVAFESAARRVYISHATHVMVYDADNAKIVGDIPNTIGVHGVAFAPEFNHGFVSCGKTNSVLMFDLKTLDTLKRTPVKKDPDAIIYDPFSKCIIACDGDDGCVSVIDAATGAVKKTIPLGGSPEFAASDENGHVYINLEDKGQVVDIDMKKFKVLHHWSLEGGEGPTGLAIDGKTHRLFSGCANKMMVILDAKSGNVLDKLPIGQGVDAVVFDPKKNLALSSNRDGTLTVVREVSPDKFEVVENVTTQPGARTEALDMKTHDIYLITSDFGAAPEATKDHPHPRPSIIPNTFRLLKFGY